MPFRTRKTQIYQYDIVVDGRRFRGSTRTTDFEKAKLVEAEIRTKARTAKKSGSRFTLSEALGTYYRDIAQHQPSAATTASQSKSLIKGLGAQTLIDSLTDADLARFVATKRASCANATVNRQIELLGRVLRRMAKIYKATVPDLDFKAAKHSEPKERIRELSLPEQDRLFAELPHDLHPAVQFALMTGARVSTIAGLLWEDVRQDAAAMLFRLKGGKTMTFPISLEMRNFLAAVPKSNVLAARRYVFTRIDKQTTERTRIVPNGGVFNAEFRAAIKRADIPDFRFHDLRHTFATRMLRQTGSIKLVSKLLGHSEIATTSRYAHVLVDDMADALNAFSAFSNAESQNFPQKSDLSN